MSDEQSVSVLLPTIEAADAIDEIADQLREDDELLVCCDAEDDPVVAADLPEGTGVVVADEPERCSGKANALAAGMAAARHERLVWTDDDFEHEPGWLDALRTDYDRQGPTTELPFFRGRDPLSLVLEPTYVLTGSVPVYARGIVWGGSVIFERSDLRAPSDAPRVDVEDALGGDGPGNAAEPADAPAAEPDAADDATPDLADADDASTDLADADGATPGPADADGTSTDLAAADDAGTVAADGPLADEIAFRAELRRTFSDDGLLTEYLDVSGAKRVREIEPPGGVRATVERHVRWTVGLERLVPVLSVALTLVATLLAVACLLFPYAALAVLTAVDYAAYRWLGIDRWTFLLAVPAVLLSVPLGIYVRSRSTLRWGGRRYRWPSQFEVEVLED